LVNEQAIITDSQLAFHNFLKQDLFLVCPHLGGFRVKLSRL
jgi:hypothetical protein